MRYKLSVPATKEQGSYNITISDSHYETKSKAALWSYNSAREHDGLPPIKKMPKGTVYEKIKEVE